jgi:hypothetical protein
MSTENLKSLAITQLDAAAGGGLVTPGTGQSASGYGAEGFQKEVNAVISPTNGATVGSVYQFARVPSNATIKHIRSVVTGTVGVSGFSADVTIAYADAADSPQLGQPEATVVTAALFAAAHDFHGDTVGVPVELTFLNQAAGKYGTLVGMNQPLWQAAGLAADPGGYFDIVLVSTNATNGLTSVSIMLAVEFQTAGQ